WFRQVLLVMTEPAFTKTLPEPSVSMPPPASPARLLLMVVLLRVRVQGVLTTFSIETPPPSWVAVLRVTTMLVKVRLARPWSRTPRVRLVVSSPGVLLAAWTAERRVTTPAGGLRMSARVLTLKTAGARRLSSPSSAGRTSPFPHRGRGERDGAGALALCGAAG